jgi:hypothetical protein
MHWTVLGLITESVLSQNANLPPGSPPGAYDPLAWGQLIDRRRPCQLNQRSTKECFYTGTPLNGPVTWTCTAGSFCVGPGQSQRCNPGFYCPVNTAMRKVL